MGGHGDVDVIGRSAGERDPSEDERKITGGRADEHPPAGRTESVDEGVQEFAGNGQVALSQWREGAHRSS